MICVTWLKKAPLALLILGAMLMFLPGQAQYGPGPSNVLDGKPVPRPSVRDNDLLWMTTVWRRIDVRQKMNHHFYFPLDPAQGRKSLYDLIANALLKERTISAYDVGPLGTDDMFTRALSVSEVERILRRTDTLQTVSIETGAFISQPVDDWIQSEDIIGYDIKERWFIDAQHSVLKVGIVGIAPVITVVDQETGEFRGTKQLFWINYRDARFAMATWPVFIRSNQLQYLSYDDIFTQRRFDGVITKVSNVYDRSLMEYLKPEEDLYQAVVEHEKLRNLELDMWNY